MPSVTYGDKVINYSIKEDTHLKSHYITVEKHAGVVLKGKPLPPELADKLILKKARWILDKLAMVGGTSENIIVTGSRIPYLGKQYYTEVFFSDDIQTPVITFNHSQFRIVVNPKGGEVQKAIQEALQEFYKAKAVEKITPRVKKWSNALELPYTALKFRKMDKRWGSCTSTNTIVINYDAIKLPFTLIDYLIVHELCHTIVKNHSKDFWSELARHLPNWKQLDERMGGMKM
jgi:predicted metal-dependent hydrolase